MDLATILGMALAMCLIFVPIIMAGTLPLFIDMPSILLVFAGSLAATMICFDLGEFFGAMKFAMKAMFYKAVDQGRIIDSMVELGEKARREGILALEREMPRLDDEFMKKALQLAVDGNEPEVIENVMLTEIDNMEARHKNGKSFFDIWANFGPAYGMIGTVVGLVQMLENLDDPANIGAGMALALITTFYGSFVANVIAIPISNKLVKRSNEEKLIKSMILFGVLSIHSGDNPRVTRDKLETFVAPKHRKGNQG